MAAQQAVLASQTCLPLAMLYLCRFFSAAAPNRVYRVGQGELGVALLTVSVVRF
jgi:hypothetical protein